MSPCLLVAAASLTECAISVGIHSTHTATVEHTCVVPDLTCALSSTCAVTNQHPQTRPGERPDVWQQLLSTCFAPHYQQLQDDAFAFQQQVTQLEQQVTDLQQQVTQQDCELQQFWHEQQHDAD